MKTSCYELAEGGHLLAAQASDALVRWRAGDGVFWIHVCDHTEPELEAMIDEVGVSGLLRRGCLQAGKATTAIALPQGAFAGWAVFADQACTRRAQFGALCLKDLLITMHGQEVERTDEMPRTVELLELEELSTSSVLFSLLVEQAQETAAAARNLRDVMLALGERMDHEPDDVEPATLELMKRRVLLTDAIAEEQEEAFAVLANARSDGLDFSSMGGPTALLTATARATNRLVDRLDRRADNLLRRYQDHEQERLSRRLGLLTIISAIFLPLTLLAGVWGMNFENMPELSFPYAYPVALSLMALIAIGFAWVFYKRGWFD